MIHLDFTQQLTAWSYELLGTIAHFLTFNGVIILQNPLLCEVL